MNVNRERAESLVSGIANYARYIAIKHMIEYVGGKVRPDEFQRQQNTYKKAVDDVILLMADPGDLGEPSCSGFKACDSCGISVACFADRGTGTAEFTRNYCPQCGCKNTC